MKTSESIIKIVPALLKAQIKITSAVKNATNPYFKSKYADLSSVIEACKKDLNDNEIVVLQPIRDMEVETVLIHTSGEWISSRTPIVCKAQNDPQALGSAISYARRYGLQSMVLIPADDDDGEGATSHTKEVSTPVKPVDEKPTEGETNQDKCDFCGTTNEYHAPLCPDNPKNSYGKASAQKKL